jgi:hypothetical protein
VDYAPLDDTAAAALYAISREQDVSLEHMGLLFEKLGLQYTPTKTKGQQSSVGGTFSIPKGSLRGLYHNHPVVPHSPRELPRDSDGSDGFSDDDIKQAKALGVPSYIVTPRGRVFRYDPSTGKAEEVLHQLPLDVFKNLLRK